VNVRGVFAVDREPGAVIWPSSLAPKWPYFVRESDAPSSLGEAAPVPLRSNECARWMHQARDLIAEMRTH
jgi:hypothetical protein